MKNIVFLTAFFFNFCICCFAQSINGRLINKEGMPLEYINIALYNLKDSSFLGGTISDNEGNFSLSKHTIQDAFLKISGMGYEDVSINIKGNDKDTIELGSIIIKASAISLNEVVVNGKRHIIYSNGGYKLSVSGTDMAKQPDIYSICSFLPFVIVNGESISMLNKGHILFILNDHEVKDMYEIKMLKPTQIKEITVKPHASVGYGSEYDAVIEIKTVANLKDFLSAQLSHSSAIARNYTNKQSLDLNFQRGKWLGYLSYNFNNVKSKENASNKYFIFDNNSKIAGANYSKNEAVSEDNSHKVVFGLSYRPMKHQLADIQYIFNYGNERSNMAMTEESSSFQNGENLATNSVNHQKNYRHNILSKYQIDFSSSKIIFNTSYIYSTVSPSNDIYSQGKAFSNIEGKNKYSIFTLKADYDVGLSKNLKLQIGSKYALTKNDGDSRSIGHSIYSMNYINTANLDDKTLAFYSLLSYNKERLITYGGIRAEYTNSNYKWNNDYSMKRNSWEYFPSIDVEYDFCPNFILDLGLNVKGTLPKFNELSPILRYINSHLYEKGNGDLKKETIRNIYLVMVLLKKISFNVNYYYVKNLPIYIFQVMDGNNNILLNMPLNMNIKYMEFNASYSDKFGFYRFAYNALLHFDFTKIAYLEMKNHNNPEFLAKMVNQFDITKRTMLFCNLDFVTSYKSLGTHVNASYGITAGAYLKLLKNNRLTLILSFNDILHKSVPSNYSTINNIRAERILSPDTRNIMLTLRFNINKYVSKFHKNDTSSSEENRIQK